MVAPDAQVIAILVASVVATTLAKETGASGFVKMIAPLPVGEISDEFTTFIAVT